MAATDRVRVSAPTEQRNPASAEIDTLDTAGVLRVINEADAVVPDAVAGALAELTAAVDLTVRALRDGGRVHYFGAGSSGRYGALDAAEIPPTFGLPPDRFVAHLAGGPEALLRAVEDVEDSEPAGRADAAGVTARDVVLGLAASGRTPYVRGALTAARAQRAATVLISSNPAAPLAAFADVHVLLDTGPEVVTGSTRMKAGTAQKMALHSFSTAVLVRLGHTYSNLMIDVAPNNAKLRARQVAILESATGADAAECLAALAGAGGELRIALVTMLAGTTPAEARERLRASGGDVRAALR
jgi:N-acetylmuramic acid 6-phosphate etherase